MSRVSVRYIIDDVPAAMHFYTTLLGFTLEHDASRPSRLSHGTACACCSAARAVRGSVRYRTVAAKCRAAGTACT
jgi:hypothetical protein